MAAQALHSPATFVERQRMQAHRATILRFSVPLARLFFASIYLSFVPNLFAQQSVDHAAAQGVLFALIAVPLVAILALLGGLSVLFGFMTPSER